MQTLLFVASILTFIGTACRPRAYNDANSTLAALVESDTPAECVVKEPLPTLASLPEDTVLYTWTDDPLAVSNVNAFLKKAATGLSGDPSMDRGREESIALNRKFLCPLISSINDIWRGVFASQKEVGGLLKSKGIMGGFGLYLATDPLTSIRYGKILVQVTMKNTSFANASKLSAEMGGPDWLRIAKAILSKQPLLIYPWQSGLFGGTPYDLAFVARSPDVIKSARVIVNVSQKTPLLFKNFPSVESSGRGFENVLAVAANQGDFFTHLLAFGGSSENDIAKAAIFSELASGAHNSSWYSHINSRCQTAVDCATAVSGALQEFDNKITLEQAVRALKNSGYLNENFIGNVAKEVLAATINQFKKTKSFENAESWYHGTISTLTNPNRAPVPKPTYLEGYRNL